MICYQSVGASWNVMAHAQKPDLVFRRNWRVHLNRRGASVQLTTGSRGVRISGSRARSEPGGTRWRTGGEVKGKLANGVGREYSHATFERGLSSITQADAHTSAASSRLNWRPHRFKWTCPFRGKTTSGFCECANTFRTSYNAECTMFRGSVKSTGYPLHLPVSPSITLPCVTLCHHISTGIYKSIRFKIVSLNLMQETFHSLSL